MKPKSILLISIFLMAATVHLQNKLSEYSVSVPGMNKPVTFVLPKAFQRATTSAERAAREELIKALEGSKSGKSVVAEAFSTDWARAHSLPILYVGTLPSVVKGQGRFAKDYWAEARAMFVRESKRQIPIIESQLQKLGHRNAKATLDRILSESGPNSALIFGFAPASDENGPAPMLLARKIRYIRQSLVLFEIAVDASDSKAVERLENYIAQSDVRE